MYVGKILILKFSTLSSYLSTGKRLYYNNSLFLNKSINLTSIGL